MSSELDPEKILASLEARRRLQEPSERIGPRTGALIALVLILLFALLALWGLLLYLESHYPRPVKTTPTATQRANG